MRDYQENFSSNSRWDYRLVSDDISLNCNIYNFFNIVSKRIIENIPNPFKINGISNVNGVDLKRTIVEALVNAITNQNYLALPGLSIKKTLNKINNVNSGDVSLGIEQAKKGGISELRNRNLMHYFRIIQVADRASTGVLNIFDTFKSYQFPTNELIVERNLIRTILNMSFIQFSITLLIEKKSLKYLLI